MDDAIILQILNGIEFIWRRNCQKNYSSRKNILLFDENYEVASIYISSNICFEFKTFQVTRRKQVDVIPISFLVILVK